MLYRLFPRDPEAGPSHPGGPLYVARALQGDGRHDAPDRYGALYLSRSRTSAVAELLRVYRRQQLTARDLLESGRTYALAAFDDAGLPDLVDLDEPQVLVQRALRPSMVATRDREGTRAIAIVAFEEGASGLSWWSTIEASWINVTLFAERVRGRLALAGDPEPLGLGHPAVRDAAEAVGVLLANPAS